MKKIFLASAVLVSLFFASCDPNEDIYNRIDDKVAADSAAPYKSKTIVYTLVAKDYSSFGNTGVDKYDAFNDTTPAKTLIPAFLAQKYPKYQEKCVAKITFNQFTPTDYTTAAKFGYELTDADYQALGNATVAANKSFDKTNKSTDLLPAFLLAKYPSAVDKDTQNVVIKYNFALSLERYAFNGTAWSRASYVSDFGKIGYMLVDADYISMGGSVATNKNFSSTASPDTYLPIFLKSKYPYAVEGSMKVVKYKYYSGSVQEASEQYLLTSGVWTKIPRYKLVVKTEQYIYVNSAWIFDPAVRVQMVNADYKTIVEKDPLLDSYKTAGYTYGASTYKNNFDWRLSEWKKYESARFDGMSDAQANAYIVEQTKKGIILVLQKNFPNAQPKVPEIGTDAYYIVTFETYNNDLTRSYPTWKFQCTAAGSPATFVFVEAVQ